MVDTPAQWHEDWESVDAKLDLYGKPFTVKGRKCPKTGDIFISGEELDRYDQAKISEAKDRKTALKQAYAYGNLCACFWHRRRDENPFLFDGDDLLEAWDQGWQDAHKPERD